ncbi:putative ABC-type sugar transport system,periplasmic component [Vibrio nigripulchritudo MADA3029]|nr:putative ABC-type sugar transport system,periplasmic component [Vibrio nigripulchritudo MADA3020]CCN54011.1 putative ABC-type sugar transport system,periplasmic component [Vibrio nigripulchritudo MADA3021]CCN57434.1 putative ABC-type sugar transport system,periplasmic component [Vibrio nigripulchritudo MADA3029]
MHIFNSVRNIKVGLIHCFGPLCFLFKQIADDSCQQSLASGHHKRYKESKMKSIKFLIASMAAMSAFSMNAHAANESTVCASLLTQSHPFYIALAKGLKAGATENNVDLKVSIANQDLAKQINDIEDCIIKNVDAIIISPVDSKGVRGPLKKAERANIPVITVDIGAENSKVVSHVATDNYGGGVEAGKLAVKHLNSKGTVVMLSYPGISSVEDRLRGFRDAVADTDIKIVAVQPGKTREESLTSTINMLQANPETDLIFAFGDDMMIGAGLAVTKQKSDAVVIGFDGMPEGIKAVDDNAHLIGVVKQDADTMGRKAIKATVDHLAGKSVDAEYPIVPVLYTGK